MGTKAILDSAQVKVDRIQDGRKGIEFEGDDGARFEGTMVRLQFLIRTILGTIIGALGAPITLPKKFVLLSLGGEAQAKVAKGEKRGFRTHTLALAPWIEMASAFGIGINTCRWAGSCRNSCVKRMGQYAIGSLSLNSRGWKTILAFFSPSLFFSLLSREVRKLAKRDRNDGFVPCFRLNCLSDLPFESFIRRELANDDGLVFYDYTKSIDRAETMSATMPEYHLCYSFNERSDEARVRKLLSNGGRVAIVVESDLARTTPLPRKFLGFDCADGDADDLVFTDGPVRVLRFKNSEGKARFEQLQSDGIASGFVLSLSDPRLQM